MAGVPPTVYLAITEWGDDSPDEIQVCRTPWAAAARAISWIGQDLLDPAGGNAEICCEMQDGHTVVIPVYNEKSIKVSIEERTVCE